MIGKSITQLSALELRHGACSDGPEWADDYYSTSIHFGPQAQHPFTRLGFLIARRAPRRVAAAAAVEKAHDATSLHRQIKAERTALSRARGEGLESLPDARRLRHQSHLQWLLIQYVAWSGREATRHC